VTRVPHPTQLGRAVAVVAVVVLALGACGSSGPSPAVKAERQAYLSQVLDEDSSLGQLRTDTQLVNLGDAACSGFGAGESYPVLADRMSLSDGNLSTADLGAVITAAAQDLCPKYSSLVS
jgi:Protein of unknown function (DUF732)